MIAGHLSGMPRVDPSQLEIVVEPTGAPKRWKWLLVVGKGRPVKNGTVVGTKDEAYLAASVERQRLIARGIRV
jgi:hypothetical protein